jgi:ribosomal protein S18 acetylase RimI-like enzyme
MNIRTLRETDIPAVIALWNECALTRPWNDPEKDIRFALASPASTILVGDEAGQIVSSVMVGHDGHRGAIYYLAVSAARHGKGLSRAMHDAAIAWLQERGVWKINLMVRSENAAVRGFYESLGYVENAVVSFGKQLARPEKHE